MLRSDLVIKHGTPPPSDQLQTVARLAIVSNMPESSQEYYCEFLSNPSTTVDRCRQEIWELRVLGEILGNDRVAEVQEWFSAKAAALFNLPVDKIVVS